MDSTALNAQCQAIIEASYPLFVIHTNHVTTLADSTLYSLCRQIYDVAITKLSLTSYTNVLSMRAILSATFDTNHRAFVHDDSENTQRILAALGSDSRGCIFAQAIAGMVSFLRSIAECTAAAPSRPLTAERVAAKLGAFEAGEEREAMLASVEANPVWSDCFEKAQIGSIIMQAIGINPAGSVHDKHETTVSVTAVDDVYNEPAFNDGPHPTRNFGVPDVFTIMALN
ncbi:hypothetical protein BD289DRAFT_484473 [Coniella lustricola]|uniref:Uncharacterized protein n=1 Tax=Coniella lustricola TaxID=2025994 RepID=A0A2T3A1V0_9PEZI|nr:hypothetical protein BD289DRAFT_484473 [Coniella lustricola]